MVGRSPDVNSSANVGKKIKITSAVRLTAMITVETMSNVRWMIRATFVTARVMTDCGVGRAEG